MTATNLERFVHSALDAMDANRTNIGHGGAVWRAELPENVARFLGRAQRDLLYTFDLERWEEGARLECLNAHSPLVHRLRDYALARGAVAVAYVSDPSPDVKFQPYLAARFRAQFSAGTVRTRTSWLGINLNTNAPVNLKGNPLDSLDLVEGFPPNASTPPCETLDSGLSVLADQWNRSAAAETRTLQAAIDRRFKLEAAEIAAAKQPAAQERLLKRLQDRLHVSVECRLDMALLLWLPVRS